MLAPPNFVCLVLFETKVVFDWEEIHGKCFWYKINNFPPKRKNINEVILAVKNFN